MPIFDHFSIVAPLYERFIRFRESESLIQWLALPVDGMILDAGGGTGRVAQALRGMASQIVIADLSMGMLRQAAQKDGLETVNAHTERLPFRDNNFERILMVDALHHVVDHRQTAAELYRVLKPGGRLIIEEPDVRRFSVKLVALAEKLALMRSHFLSPARIAALFPEFHSSTSIHTESFNAYVVVIKGEE